ncbi:MAG: metallophosphoesterase [Bacteroidales bacterium]
MKKIFFVLLCSFSIDCLWAAKEKSPTVIIQVSDPQMGFYHDNRDMDFEVKMLNKAVCVINKVKPDAVIFTGDYVHNPNDTIQWNAFKEIVGSINDDISQFYIPGNHDVLLEGDSVNMKPYFDYLNNDRFNTCLNDILLTGINSVYIKDEKVNVLKEEEQLRWLDTVLKKKKKGSLSIVFAHHPFFLEEFDEPEGYSTIALEKRKRYFSLFKKRGVDAVFSGHLHDNKECRYRDILMITTSAVGRQLGKATPGVRILVIDKGILSHKFYSLEEFSEQETLVVKSHE